MQLVEEISRISSFDVEWKHAAKREGLTLRQLKSVATVQSVGASTRIEGSKMTDEQVQVFLEKIKTAKLEESDQQEVAGYFDALDVIVSSYRNIAISEGNIKNLHKILMRHCAKDEWHRGEYKQVSNSVEATYSDGSKQIVFKTTEPGYPTQEAMQALIEWYHTDKQTLPILKTALFVYDFLSIHPFQDGNGRLSRLLTTLLLLKQGYAWIEYISFEHEIERRKAEYYEVLMQTQKQRPGERVDAWVHFFLSSLLNIQELLMKKIEVGGSAAKLTPKEKMILSFIENHPGARSGEVAAQLNLALPTVKKMLAQMLKNNLLQKHGRGAGTNYTVT